MDIPQKAIYDVASTRVPLQKYRSLSATTGKVQCEMKECESKSTEMAERVDKLGLKNNSVSILSYINQKEKSLENFSFDDTESFSQALTFKQ